MAGKKRRRAVAAGDGEAVSAIYESIVGEMRSRHAGERRHLVQKRAFGCVFSYCIYREHNLQAKYECFYLCTILRASCSLARKRLSPCLPVSRKIPPPLMSKATFAPVGK